ncbi:stage V sporulation protein B [Zhaonella formicivorans]|uniref:stage V sporulation protein B n=1 Tax=Zhaonella formicivorans TaxID=2528593 RepID=UPI0010CE8C4D|nr:stage V sporulation protein B [Zhaonella formicivorans]
MQKFVQGALLLMIASFTTRVLAFIYRVYIVRLIGAEGIGLYEMVFPVYSLILVLTTAGIPVAVSKLISEEYARKNIGQVKKIFFVALQFLLGSGLVSTVLMIWIAPYMTGRIFTDVRVYWPFITAIPAVFIVAVGSAFRGYFQGLQNMLPSAVSQIVEQLVRFTIGISAASFLLSYGIEFASAGLALAMVCGELAGLLILLCFFWQNREIRQIASGPTQSIIQTLANIYGLAIPVTLTRVVLAASLTLQAVLIPKRLIFSGFTINEATKIYGHFSGMAFSLINLPSIITVSLAISLVPAISEALACINFALIKKRINQAVRITVLTAVPCLVIFTQLAQEIMILLYNAPEASPVLKALALGCPFFYLQQTTGGILQGLGKVNLIFRNVLVGTLITLTGIYWLTAIPGIGIKGTSAAVIAGAAVTAALNFYSLQVLTGFKIDWGKNFISPAAAGLLMNIFLNYIIVHRMFYPPGLGALMNIIGMGLFVYILGLYCTGGLNNADFNFIKRHKPWR